LRKRKRKKISFKQEGKKKEKKENMKNGRCLELCLMLLLWFCCLMRTEAGFNCSDVGLPRTAKEYYAITGTTPTHGQVISICIDQNGTAYYPITMIAGVNGSDIRQYIPVNQDLNQSFFKNDTNPLHPFPFAPSCDSLGYVQTNFSAVSFNPFNMTVDEMDGTFSTTVGCVKWSAGQIVKFLGWAGSVSCGDISSTFANLQGTYFEFDYSRFRYIVDGALPKLNFNIQNPTNVSINAFGSCGWIAPYSAARQAVIPYTGTTTVPLLCSAIIGGVKDNFGSSQVVLKLSNQAPLAPPPPSLTSTVSISSSTTPSQTLSASVSLTSSQTATITASPTTSLSLSSTSSPSLSQSPTQSQTRSISPSQTISITPTVTMSSSPSTTISPTSTVSLSSTASVSPSQTLSLSSTASTTSSITNSHSPTVTPTSTSSKTISASASQTMSLSTSTSITPSQSFTAVPSSSFSASASFTPSQTVTRQVAQGNPSVSISSSRTPNIVVVLATQPSSLSPSPSQVVRSISRTIKRQRSKEATRTPRPQLTNTQESSDSLAHVNTPLLVALSLLASLVLL